MKEKLILWLTHVSNNPMTYNDMVIKVNANQMRLFENDTKGFDEAMKEIESGGIIQGFKVTHSEPWHSFFIQSCITLQRIIE